VVPYDDDDDDDDINDNILLLSNFSLLSVGWEIFTYPGM
jgi:hypothetical protein